ncbi:MAG: hypothetical protein KA211_06655, partial [Xylophilus sp.]|nr:hypothetical protein [Xylophilus sp.]
DEALAQVLDLGVPALLASNRAFHKLLVNGAPVSYQVDGPRWPPQTAPLMASQTAPGRTL